jgi:hypothetical protein
MHAKIFTTAVALALAGALGGTAQAAQKVKQIQTLGGAGGVAGAGSLTSNTGGYPTFAQVNGRAATAVTRHESCGAGCWTHALVSDNGNRNLTIKIGLSCPAAGDYVERLYFNLAGDPITPLYEYDGGVKHQQRIVAAVIQPWSVTQFENAANIALGGNWAGAEYPAPAQTGQIQLHEYVEAYGECASYGSAKHKQFPIHTTLNATDKDFAAPARVQTSVKLK